MEQDQRTSTVRAVQQRPGAGRGLQAGARAVVTFLLVAWMGIVGPVTAAYAQEQGAPPDDPVEALLRRGRSAGADTELLQTAAERAQRNGLSPAETASLLQPAVALAEQDLPARLLLQKTLEGLAKRVPPGRMTPVLQQVRTHTEQAGGLVSSWLKAEGVRQKFRGADAASAEARGRLVENVAQARQQGVTLDHVRGVLQALPDQVARRAVPLDQVAAAMSMMPDLPAPAREGPAGRQLIVAALNAGYSADDLRRLPAALQSAQKETGRPPARLVGDVAQAIGRGTPAAQVLQGLFQGGVPGVGPPQGAGGGPPQGSPPGQGKPPDAGPPPGKGKGNPPTGGGSSGGGSAGGG